MCCGSNTQTTVQTPNVPDWLEDYYQYQTAAQKELYDTARDIYRERQDFPLYSEPRIQDFTTDQMGSFNLIRDNIGVADSSLEAAVARWHYCSAPCRRGTQTCEGRISWSPRWA